MFRHNKQQPQEQQAQHTEAHEQYALQQEDQAMDSAQINSSRICVKNLPIYLAENRLIPFTGQTNKQTIKQIDRQTHGILIAFRLREIFAAKGEITDVKIMRTQYVMQKLI